MKVPVQDLTHAYRRRLVAADVSFEDRHVLLGRPRALLKVSPEPAGVLLGARRRGLEKNVQCRVAPFPLHGKGCAMAYFLFRVLKSAAAENVGVCEGLEEAVAKQTGLLDAGAAAGSLRIVFADNETSARERLSHVRSPDEGIIGEAS